MSGEDVASTQVISTGIDTTAVMFTFLLTVMVQFHVCNKFIVTLTNVPAATVKSTAKYFTCFMLLCPVQLCCVFVCCVVLVFNALCSILTAIDTSIVTAIILHTVTVTAVPK